MKKIIKSVVMASLFLCFGLVSMENKNNIQKMEKLKVSIEDREFELSLSLVLDHILSYSVTTDEKGKESISGFHWHSNKYRIEFNGYNLNKINQDLWIVSKGDVNKFHAGYLIYKGKNIGFKTFFPCNYNLENFSNLFERIQKNIKQFKQINLDYSLVFDLYESNVKLDDQIISVVVKHSKLRSNFFISSIFPLIKQDKSVLNDLNLCINEISKIEFLKNNKKNEKIEEKKIVKVEEKINLNPSKPSFIKFIVENRDKPEKDILKSLKKNMYLVKNSSSESGFDIESLINEEYGTWGHLDCLDIAAKSIHIASYFGWSKIVKWLIENKSKVDDDDCQGMTPLMFACQKGYFEVVKILIENGASVNKQDKNYRSVLLLALFAGNINIVKLLYEKDADLGYENGDFELTALGIASRLGYKDLVNFLIELGFDITSMLINGKTALMIASKQGHEEVVKMILNQKNITLKLLNFKNYKDKNALAYAKTENIKKLIFNKIEELEKIK